MEIPDLYRFPEAHPPSPYRMPVTSGYDGDRHIVLTLPADLGLFAVGWLSERVFSIGPVAEECVDRLVVAHEDPGNQFLDGFAGIYRCRICPPFEIDYESDPGGIGQEPKIHWRDREILLSGHGHHLVKYGRAVYMCPELILHYIFEHGYQPPAEFMEAVNEGVFLTEDDLEKRLIPHDEFMTLCRNVGNQSLTVPKLPGLQDRS